MPRALKSDKFFMYNARKKGYWKNKILIGVNHLYEGGTNNLSLQDLIDFLKEKNIETSSVPLNSSFSVTVPVKQETLTPKGKE